MKSINPFYASTCDFIGCKEKASVTGQVYGHVKGSEESDSLIMVFACAAHAKRDDFFPNQPVCKGES